MSHFVVALSFGLCAAQLVQDPPKKEFVKQNVSPALNDKTASEKPTPATGNEEESGLLPAALQQFENLIGDWRAHGFTESDKLREFPKAKEAEEAEGRLKELQKGT